MGAVTLEDDLEASKIQTLTEASDDKKKRQLETMVGNGLGDSCMGANQASDVEGHRTKRYC